MENEGWNMYRRMKGWNKKGEYSSKHGVRFIIVQKNSSVELRTPFLRYSECYIPLYTARGGLGD